MRRRPAGTYPPRGVTNRGACVTGRRLVEVPVLAAGVVVGEDHQPGRGVDVLLGRRGVVDVALRVDDPQRAATGRKGDLVHPRRLLVDRAAGGRAHPRVGAAGRLGVGGERPEHPAFLVHQQRHAVGTLRDLGDRVVGPAARRGVQDQQLQQRQLEVDVGVLHRRVEKPARGLVGLEVDVVVRAARALERRHRRRPLVGSGPVLVAAEVHAVRRLAVLAAPHDPDVIAAVRHDRGGVVDGHPAGVRQGARSAPLRLVGATGRGVDVDGVALLPRGPQRAGGVLVDREGLALGGVDRGGIAGVEPCTSGCAVVAVAEQQARVPRDRGLGVLRELVGGDEQLRAVPEHVGVRVGTAVGEDPVVLPRPRRRVEPEDVEVLADDVPHVRPPHPVVEPQDALGTLGAGGRAPARVGRACGLDTGGRGRRHGARQRHRLAAVGATAEHRGQMRPHQRQRPAKSGGRVSFSPQVVKRTNAWLTSRSPLRHNTIETQSTAALARRRCLR